MLHTVLAWLRRRKMTRPDLAKALALAAHNASVGNGAVTAQAAWLCRRSMTEDRNIVRTSGSDN